MGVSPVDAVKRPARFSSVASVLAATLAIAILTPLSRATTALGVELLGVAVLAGGAALARRDHRVVGLGVAVLGGLVSMGGIVLAVSSVRGFDSVVVVVSAVVGVFVLSLALVPLRGSGSRWLVKFGAGAVFVAVLASGLFRLVGLRALLIAGVGAIVAWDLGEQAINVGEQLGRVAETRRLEAVHGGGALLVGGVAVGAGSVARGVGTPGMPLPALAAFLVAVLLFTAALHA